MRPSLFAIAALALAGCDLPRDPDHTMEHVRNGTLRVGVAIHPPYTRDSAGTLGGLEPALVRALAAELGAKVEWTTGGESVLFPKLHERELDIVIAGLDTKSPSAASAGMTRPWHTVYDPDRRELVWALAPGENAFQMRVERFLRAHRTAIDGMKARLGEEPAR